MRPTDARRVGTAILAVVAALITFIVTYQFTYFFSLSAMLALSLACFCAYAAFHNVPIILLSRLKADTLHPEGRPYKLTKSTALALIKSELSRQYFAGKSWHYKDCEDSAVQDLLFTCRFQEQEITDKGAGVVELELQLLVQVFAVDGNCVVQLDYQLSDVRPSITANDICHATTWHIEASLLTLQEMAS